MAFEPILDEVDQLHNVSDRLEGLAENHPPVLEALLAIAGNVRRVATVLAVLVTTKLQGGDGHPLCLQNEAYLVNSRLGSLTFRDLPMLPLSGFSPQNLHTIDGVVDGLPLFWCSAMIFEKHSLPFVYFGLCYLNALLHPRPIGLKQSRPVRFVPAICHSHANLANPPLRPGTPSYVGDDAISKKLKTGQF